MPLRRIFPALGISSWALSICICWEILGQNHAFLVLLTIKVSRLSDDEGDARMLTIDEKRVAQEALVIFSEGQLSEGMTST